MSHILEFLDLKDVPSTYSGYPSGYVKVNSGASALEFVAEGPFLPLTAGSGNPLSDDLHIENSEYSVLYLAPSGSATNRTTLSYGTALFNVLTAGTGAVTMAFNPGPESASAATMKLFNQTNTSGTKLINMYVGDGTSDVQHAFNLGTGAVELCKEAGSLSVGGGEVVPWLYGQCDTTNAYYYKLVTTGTGGNETFHIRILHSHHNAKTFMGDYIINNNSGAPTIRSMGISGPGATKTDTKVNIEGWTQADNSTEIWIRTEVSYGNFAAQCYKIQTGASLTGSMTPITDFESGPTTTAPSTGTKNIDTDNLPFTFHVAGNVLKAYINDNEVLSGGSAQISTMTEKTTPVSADLLVIEDSAASNAKKKVQISNLPAAAPDPPKTTLVTKTTGDIALEDTWETLVDVSSGPYMLVSVANGSDDAASRKYRITIDGTLVWTGAYIAAQFAVDTGPGSSANPGVLFARSTLKVEGYNPSATNANYQIIYHTLSFS